MEGWSNNIVGYFTKLALGTLFTVGTTIGIYQSCNKEKESQPDVDITINYGVNNKYAVRVFKEFNDTVISIEQNYIKGMAFKPMLIARGLTSPQYNIEIRGFNIHNDELLKSYVNRDKLIALRDSALFVSNENRLESKLD